MHARVNVWPVRRHFSLPMDAAEAQTQILEIQKSHILTAHRWLHECIICRMHWMHSVSSHSPPLHNRSVHFDSVAASPKNTRTSATVCMHGHVSDNGQVKTLSKHSLIRKRRADRADDYVLTSQMRPVCARQAMNNQHTHTNTKELRSMTHGYARKCNQRYRNASSVLETE